MVRTEWRIGDNVMIDRTIQGVVDGYYRDLVMVKLDSYMTKPFSSQLWWAARRELDNEKMTITVIPVHPENLSRIAL